MYKSVSNEIPEFLANQVVYCDNLWRKKCKTCLLLTKDLKLYEFKCKSLLHSIRLDTTCLAKVKDLIKEYQGPKSKYYNSNCANETDNKDDPMSSQSVASAMLTDAPDSQRCSTGNALVYFGKYIYLNFGISKFYLLLHCWDKLIAVQRLHDEDRFEMVTEFEDVSSYRITHGKCKYQAVVEIRLNNGKVFTTDFQKDNTKNGDTPPLKKGHTNEFKQLLERIRIAQTELKLHKSITHKEFERLRESQTFGNHMLRSSKLEEKQMLSRCGDIWIRILTNSADAIVIGIPLVNNCSPPNLTILKNVQPIFKINETHMNGMSYQYHLYSIKNEFENLETLETFLQSENEQEQTHTVNAWSENDNMNIPPESFVVLLIQFKLSEVLALEECPLYLYYEVDRCVQWEECVENEPRKFKLQMFVKNIDFYQVLNDRVKYELRFDSETLHQDFLAIAMGSVQTKLSLVFNSYEDVGKFKQLFCKKFDFDIMNAGNCANECNPEMENSENTNTAKFPHIIFYNKKSNSIWYGCLLLIATVNGNNEYNSDGEFKILCKFYTKSKDNILLLLKLLLNELTSNECKVNEIIGPLCTKDDVNALLFENTLRKEVQILLEIVNNRSDDSNKLEKLFKELLYAQFQTDLLFSGLKL